MLEGIATRQSESYQIASQLAARLGHPRVYPVDDHTGDNLTLPDRKAFAREMEAAWKTGSAELDKHIAEEDEMAKGKDLLPLYRYLNDPERLNTLAEVNVSAALKAHSPLQSPQKWVNGWEIRNLRMVANVAQTFRERPGVRVLSVVGASHKPWFDQWLGRLAGVDIVDVEPVLR